MHWYTLKQKIMLYAYLPIKHKDNKRHFNAYYLEKYLFLKTSKGQRDSQSRGQYRACMRRRRYNGAIYVNLN